MAKPTITVTDNSDAFVAHDNRCEYKRTDGSERTYSAQNRFRAYLIAAAQMFFDHETSFEEDDKELAKKYRPIFEQMFRDGRELKPNTAYAFAPESSHDGVDVLIFVPNYFTEWSADIEGAGYVCVERATGRFYACKELGTNELPAFTFEDIEGLKLAHKDML